MFFLILATLIPLCNFLGKFLGRVACTTSETLNFPLHRTVFSPICCLLHWIIVATPSFFKVFPHFHPQWLPECDFLLAPQYLCDRSLQQPLLILLHLPTVSVLVFLAQNSVSLSFHLTYLFSLSHILHPSVPSNIRMISYFYLQKYVNPTSYFCLPPATLMSFSDP